MLLRKQKIAIIGAGTAGLATACFLHGNGHDVTLYEKFPAPKPVGAGLLLQPTGLAVLGALGLDWDIIAKGSIIKQLHGKAVGSRHVTLDVRYRWYKDHYFGIGTHRGDLFSALYDKAVTEGVRIVVAKTIVAIETVDNKSCLVDEQGEKSDFYDLVVDCSGARSHIRQQYAPIKINKPYPYGALWGMIDIPDGSGLRLDTLDQRYKDAGHMLGILPVGRNATDTATRAAFFWSMRVTDHVRWRATPLRQWQDDVGALWPEIKEVIGQFTCHDDLTFAQYSDVILKKYHTRNIAFIGDAAHCTSPQLGQGANMALVDARVLTDCLSRATTIEQALLAYSRQRKRHLWLYQLASRALTPFFQSDSWILPKLRFLLCGLACRIPLTRRMTAKLLSGTMLGPVASLNPGQWASDYDLDKRAAKASIA